MKNVTDRLLPDKDKSDELEVFLGTRGDSKQIESRQVAYEGGQLIIEYSKQHKINAIWVSDNYSPLMISHLQQEIVDALSEDGTEVGQRYLHSLYKTDGFFRHEDSFQILPSPPDAPQPEFLYAQHPFLLEYSYPKSSHQMVNQHRSTRRFSELSLLLNALLRSLYLPSSSATHEWVVTPDPNWTSHYLQLGYFGGKEHRPKAADGFSMTEGLTQIQSVASRSYYAQLGVEPGKSLQLPDIFTKLVIAFDQLNEESKARFCRASYWSHVGSRIFPISKSASFAALVSSIEVFLPDPDERCEKCGRPTSTERCPICNQPIVGPTKQFRDFVDKYAPGVPISDRNRLYSRRSSLSHGSTLLPGDLSEIGFRFTSAQTEVWSEQNLLSQIVQLVLVNWLNSQGIKAIS
jgi:hypothetical protein